MKHRTVIVDTGSASICVALRSSVAPIVTTS